MKEKLSTIKANLQELLRRIEGLKIDKPDYIMMGKLVKLELKVDEATDMVNQLYYRKEELNEGE